jgi:hypothetical protein
MLTNLDKLGMVAFRSSASSCVAALIRAAVSGKLLWADAWLSMTISAEEHLPFAAIVKEEPWGKHWSAPAFAAHLRLAASGRPPLELPAAAHGPFRSAVSAARAELAADSTAKVQKIAYSTFMNSRFSTDVNDSLAVLFSRLFGFRVCCAFGSLIRISIAKLSPQCASFALRTLANAWPTAHRMHSEPLPCLFGCQGEGNRDSLTHYIECPLLHDAVFRALGHRRFPAVPHHRFGLFPVARAEASLCAIACDVYLTWKGLINENLYSAVANARLRNLAITIVRKHQPRTSVFASAASSGAALFFELVPDRSCARTEP